jgi:hypothetical protein
MNHWNYEYLSSYIGILKIIFTLFIINGGSELVHSAKRIDLNIIYSFMKKSIYRLVESVPRN